MIYSQLCTFFVGILGELMKQHKAVALLMFIYFDEKVENAN